MLVVLLLVLAVRAATAGSSTLDLAGEWRLRLDPQDQGVSARWPAAPLAGEDRITLPNTTIAPDSVSRLILTRCCTRPPFP